MAIRLTPQVFVEVGVKGSRLKRAAFLLFGELHSKRGLRYSNSIVEAGL
jgi:hypothetical protein